MAQLLRSNTALPRELSVALSPHISTLITSGSFNSGRMRSFCWHPHHVLKFINVAGRWRCAQQLSWTPLGTNFQPGFSLAPQDSNAHPTRFSVQPIFSTNLWRPETYLSMLELNLPLKQLSCRAHQDHLPQLPTGVPAPDQKFQQTRFLRFPPTALVLLPFHPADGKEGLRRSLKYPSCALCGLTLLKKVFRQRTLKKSF